MFGTGSEVAADELLRSSVAGLPVWRRAGVFGLFVF
jgi:hypothetical protein